MVWLLGLDLLEIPESRFCRSIWRMWSLIWVPVRASIELILNDPACESEPEFRTTETQATCGDRITDLRIEPLDSLQSARYNGLHIGEGHVGVATVDIGQCADNGDYLVRVFTA